MVEPVIPAEVVELAEARSRARAERDWQVADQLKDRIEAAGWRIVDDGLAFELAPSRPPDRTVDGVTWYGAAEAVPPRSGQAGSAAASVIVVAPPGVSIDATLRALDAHAPAGTEVVVVANGPDPVAGPCTEIVRTSEPFGPSAALEAGLRRCSGEVVIVLGADRAPSGDIVAPLRAALAEPDVAVAGIEGLSSADLRRYGPVVDGEATALRDGCYAFRRADAIRIGPLDMRLHLAGSVATALSLELRDAGPGDRPRRALALSLPLSKADRPPSAEHARAARRDAYRLADRFSRRTWLAEDRPPPGRYVGDRAGHDDERDDRDEASHTREA